ncbi:MAG: hypothetical protein P4L77_01545 [Sulfuriferula sp.]|nr:hypothetical protein [Sulfuriferula sp.]
MSAPLIGPDQLRELIGLSFMWKNERYTAIEIIDHPPALIAQKHIPASVIQSDVHGRAHRQISASVSIPIYSADGLQLHPEFLLIKF